MFTDQTLTVAPAAAQTLPKVTNQGMSSTYSNADGTLTETISHAVQKSGDVRSLVKVVLSKPDPDPGATLGKDLALGIHVVVERPATGFTATEVDALWAALKAQMTTAFMARIYGKES